MSDDRPTHGPAWLAASISRRRFLNVAALTATGTVIAACSSNALSSPSSASSSEPSVGPSVEPSAVPSASQSFDWQGYAGTELNACLSNGPEWEKAKAHLAEFETLTGMKVNFQDLELDAMREKVNVVFAAASPEIDVWITFPIREGVGFAQAGWYENLEPYLADPSLTAPEYDFNDLETALRLCMVDARPGKATIGDGTLIAMPLWWEGWPLYYNKDILDAAGVSVPTTMDELEAGIAKCHNPQAGIYGWATRGLSPLNTATCANIFFAMGAQWTDAEGRASLDTPEAANAIDWYGRLMRKYGPPHGETLDIGPANDLFIQGKVAFYADSSGWVSSIADPSISKVAGKFGLASWPAGPAKRAELIEAWGVTVSPFSTKKQAAWLYVQFLTGKMMDLEFSKTGDYPARESVRTSPEYAAVVASIAPSLPDLQALALKDGVTNAYPPINGTPAWRQVFGDILVRAMQGEDPKALAKEANDKLQLILDGAA